MTVLFVVATIVIFLGIDWLLRWKRGELSRTVKVRATPDLYPVRVPEGIFFARSHTWLSLFPSGSIRLGVDDFIGRVFEKPEIILLKRSGEFVRKGEPLFVLKEGTHELTIRSPLDGTTISVNEDLQANPAWLRERLFSDGWCYVMKPKLAADLRTLLIGSETRAWIKDEFRRLRDVLAGASSETAPAYLQDGGPPIAGAMKNLDDRTWKEFEQAFLQVG